MFDMLYVYNRKILGDEEKGDGEVGRIQQEVEVVVSFVIRIFILQVNFQIQDESVRRVDVGCLDNWGSVKVFVEKFNSGDLGRGFVFFDVEFNDKVLEIVLVQLKIEFDYIWD